MSFRTSCEPSVSTSATNLTNGAGRGIDNLVYDLAGLEDHRATRDTEAEQPEGNGCIERFFRTLKEQLLWVRRFRDLEELRTALTEFRQHYNQHWIIHRLGYRTPAQARREFALEIPIAA